MSKEREVFPDHDDVVVAAVIFNERGEVLIAQRAQGERFSLKWEFPGGKVEDTDMTGEDALVREISEELGVKAAIVRQRFHTEHEDKRENSPFTGFYFFECEIEGEIKMDPEVYNDIRWVGLEALEGYDFTPASASFSDSLVSGNGIVRGFL